MLQHVYLANPRGFCAGVRYALSYLDKVNEDSNEQVYARREIVHNQRVVSDMKKKGIKFVDELDEVPDNSVVVFSAHGVSPEVVNYAKKRNMKIADATCPLVTRVHRKAIKLNSEYEIIYIGHEGHDEAVGTMGEAKMHLVETEEDVELLLNKVDKTKPITYLMQTTLSVRETKKIVDKIVEVFPHIEHPKKDDICYATTERQEAVDSMMDFVDCMLVVGAKNSSNSVRLMELAKKSKPSSFRVFSASELEKDYFQVHKIFTLGITAGASTPQVSVDEILNRLREFYPEVKIELFPKSNEDSMSFKLPKQLLK